MALYGQVTSLRSDQVISVGIFKSLKPVIFITSAERRRLCFTPVRPSVCLSAGLFRNLRTNFGEIFRKGGDQVKIDQAKFWWRFTIRFTIRTEGSWNEPDPEIVQ